MPKNYPLIFERSRAGRRASSPPAPPQGPPLAELLGQEHLRSAPPRLPEVSELELVRHYTGLSRRNYGIDLGFYPLGSCTMKYNPHLFEELGGIFSELHPYQGPATVQGALRLLFELQQHLCAIAGMDAFTLQPAAGAHGELTGILIIRAYFQARGEKRSKIIVPDAAHGTNPATARMAGYQVLSVPTGPSGEVEVQALAPLIKRDVAAIMLTNPNTLGLFERHILEITHLARGAGVQLYYDGANLNAIVGRARPGDMGFDVVHFNLHKTFSTPHGGGGPGAGPVGVKKHLAPYLPVPTVAKGDQGYYLEYQRPESIGQVRSFYGNVGNLVRAYAYICAHGPEGLRQVSAMAVLNANYLRARLEKTLPPAVQRRCMHEFVLSAGEKGRALKIAKRLLDYGYHPPTIYFPLIVREALMIEPTETETLETLDDFAAALEAIVQEDPLTLDQAPTTTVVGRLDEANAARHPVLRWQPEEEQ